MGSTSPLIDNKHFNFWLQIPVLKMIITLNWIKRTYVNKTHYKYVKLISPVCYIVDNINKALNTIWLVYRSYCILHYEFLFTIIKCTCF